MKFRTPAVSMGMQVRKMMVHFPDFKYSRPNNIPTWSGHLMPFTDSENYSVKIEYRFDNQYSKHPRVWVISPEIAPDAPHVYPNKELCLYFPRDGTWSPYKYISDTIVPLTAAWLGFYELWKETKIWYGPEAPHRGNKKKN